MNIEADRCNNHPIDRAEPQGVTEQSQEFEGRKFSAFFAANRFGEAESVARRMIQAWPDYGAAWKALSVVLTVSGRAAEALPVARRTLELLPADAEVHNYLATVLQALNQHAEAEAYYRQALALNPAEVAVHRNLGNLQMILGRPAEAAQSYRRALEQAPDNPVLHGKLGIALHQTSRFDEAALHFRRAVTLKPDYVEAHNGLGAALQYLGKLSEAEACYRHALALNPAYQMAHINLGNVLREFDRLTEAETSYRTAVMLMPHDPIALNSLGNALKDLERYSEAEASYRQALAIKPDYAEAYSNLGVVLRLRGNLSEAIACYQRSLALNSGQHAVHSNLGDVLREHGQMIDAENCFLRALDLNAKSPMAHAGYGALLRDMGRLSEAEAHFRCALELRPDNFSACNDLGNALSDLGRPEEAEASYRRALEIRPDYPPAHSNLLFLLAYFGLGTSKQYLAQAETWETATVPKNVRTAAKRKSFSNPNRAGRRLRIGYVSGDFRMHAVSYFMERMLEFHDRKRVEIFAYPTTGMRDTVTERIQQKVDHWHVLAGISDDEAVALVSKHEIDVLIDLCGHTAHNRLGVFARRAAPVQCDYLGYFASTGLSEIDYVIGDSTLIPSIHDDQYCEKIWRLPRVWVSYAAPQGAPDPVREPRSEGRICLGSFNHLRKITERTVGLWAKVLHRIPNAYLLLKTKELEDASNRGRMLAAFGRHGVSESRVELLGRTDDLTAHMALYGRVDIALDPVGGHGGATTTCYALWMGVPVVALEGERYGQRMSHSILHSIGRGDWSAASEADYVENVAKMATSPLFISQLRASQRDVMRRSPLMDARGMAQALEDAYESMFDCWYERSRKV